MSTTHDLIRETHIIGADTKELIPQGLNRRDKAPIYMVGLSDAGPDFRFVRHNPDFAQLLIPFSGHGRVLVGNRWKSCPPGTAYLTPPWTLHAYHTQPKSRWGLAWVLYKAGPKCPIHTSAPSLLRLDHRPFQPIIDNLHRESITPAQPLFMRTWLALLHLHLARVLQSTGQGDALWPVWDAVAANLAAPWTVLQLAALASISGEHLRRLCRQQLGCTPMQQVTTLRMRRAAELLRTTFDKIPTIAAAVGYANRFAFSTTFTRTLHQSPAHYRHTPQPPPY